MGSLPPMEGAPPAEASTRLAVVASPTLNQDQLWKLFDLVPGLDFIDLRRDRKSGQVSPLTVTGGRESGPVRRPAQ